MLVVADSPFSDIVRHERYKSEQNAKAKTKAVRISNFSPEIWARNMIIADYSANADSIVLQYEKDEYEMQKNKLSSRYFLEFEDDEIMFLDSVYRSSAVIGDYIFRILSTDDFYDEELEYPYTHMIIATNDKENKIAYIAYSMTGTDSEAFAQFVLNDCGWTHILN